MNPTDLSIGDLVEVHYVVCMGPDMWIACEIERVNEGSIDVKPLAGVLPGGYTAMSLPLPQDPKKWRRI